MFQGFIVASAVVSMLSNHLCILLPTVVAWLAKLSSVERAVATVAIVVSGTEALPIVASLLCHHGLESGLLRCFFCSGLLAPGGFGAPVSGMQSIFASGDGLAHFFVGRVALSLQYYKEHRASSHCTAGSMLPGVHSLAHIVQLMYCCERTQQLEGILTKIMLL